jgi:hypothetical protein
LSEKINRELLNSANIEISLKSCWSCSEGGVLEKIDIGKKKV